MASPCAITTSRVPWNTLTIWAWLIQTLSSSCTMSKPDWPLKSALLAKVNSLFLQWAVLGHEAATHVCGQGSVCNVSMKCSICTINRRLLSCKSRNPKMRKDYVWQDKLKINKRALHDDVVSSRCYDVQCVQAALYFLSCIQMVTSFSLARQ